MDKFMINGGNKLYGEVEISGAKNAAVAIIPAAILADGVCRIENIPAISDVGIIARLLFEMGAKVKMINKSTLEVDCRHITSPVASYELVRHMRASYYLLGSLLGRFNKASVAMPGGCNFGVRPIDLHLKGFEALGATSKLNDGMIELEADELHGTNIFFDIVSVGATINIMLAAVKAKGLTILENAAKEPHIVDLANFLNSMGADIRGAGTDVIKIHGVEKLSGTTYSIIPDQIEAGTYMAVAAAAGGDVLIKNVIPKHLESISAKLEEMGVEISAVLSMAEGTSIVTEGVWDNRFRYTEELRRMGAKVSVEGRVAVFEGVPVLKAAPVKATDLRAGAAVMIAALAAEGTTEIEEIQHIERGYEDIEKKLLAIGADIRRVHVPAVHSGAI